LDNASREPLHKSRTRIWHFDKPLEATWPVLSDTARFNEAAGLPRHGIIETPRDDGSVEYLARARIASLSPRMGRKARQLGRSAMIRALPYFS
jgi:hypothetical protein